MFFKLAERITQQLENDNVISSEKRELYKYGFQQGFILALNFLTSIAIGIIFGMFFECILFLVAYMPLRSYAGGHHSDSSEKCYIVSSLIMLIWMCFLKFEILPISCCVIMLLIGACICFTFAPIESNNKPLDEREQNVFRQKSLIILAVEIFLWLFMSIILRKYEAIIPIVFITEAIMLILGKAKNRHDKRPEFKRLIEDCRKGKIDRIYTKSISRFARNTRDCLKNVRELKSLGITIFFEKENIDTANIADEMMITIMGGLAQEESVSISQNMQWSIHKRMQNGTYIASNQPYGYDKVDGKLVVNESEAAIVRRIYHEYLNGRGLNAICHSLNADGLIMGKSKIVWKKKAVRYILTNEKYIGDCLWRKNYTENVFPFRKPRNRGQADQYYVTDDHEPIISREVFERVQELLKERGEFFGNTEFKTYPLTKKIKCGNCGKTFRKKNINDRFYWVCMQHDYAAESCPSKGISQDIIYSAFIRLFNKLQQNYKMILIPMQNALQELKIRKFIGNVYVIDIHRNIAQLREQSHVIAGLRTKGFLSEEKYQEQTAELNRKISKLQNELKMLTKSDDEDETLEQVNMLTEYFENRKELMIEFEEKAFEFLVDKIVANQNELEFHLLGDLKFTEKVY